MSTSHLAENPWKYLGVVAALVIPVALTVKVSYRQALREQQLRAGILAAEVLDRSHAVSAQIYHVKTVLESNSAPAPCSAASIRLMRNLALGSSYLQGVGYIRNDRLLCSSYNADDDGVPVGPPDYLSSRGAWVRRAVELPIGTHQRFLIVTEAYSGYSSLVLPDLVLDVGRENSDVTLGLRAVSNGRVIFGRGQVESLHLPNFDDGEQELTWVDSRFVGVMKRSHAYDYAGFALIPVSMVRQGWLNASLRMVPGGILLGVVLMLLTLSSIRRRSGMPAQLDRAIRSRELFLVYMPIVDLVSGKVVGAEALLRWRRPDGTMIGPGTFVPIAEQHNLIGKLTGEMLRLFVEDARTVLPRHPQIYVALNLSSEDFSDPEIVGRLCRAKEESGMQKIMVEATEGAFLDIEQASHTIRQMRQFGFDVAIDDFGTGYSCLSYLGQLEIDCLKIDRSFVSTIGTGSVMSHVIDLIIKMAKDLRLTIIAEGVETQEQADYLQARGVKYAQGWLFGKAMPAHQFAASVQHSDQSEPTGDKLDVS